jgi:hypothetical protein
LCAQVVSFFDLMTHDRTKIWAHQELARASLERVVKIADRHGIEILPVKGVLSARKYYDDVSERPMQDVDVRVTRSALARLRAIGPKEGLHIIHDSPAYENLVFDTGGMMVEIEAHLGPPGVCSIAIDELLVRASVQSATFGFSCLEPALHDHALLLVVNAFKDKLVDAMPWALRDLMRVVKQPGFDARAFADLARRGNVASLVWIVASFLVEHGTPDLRDDDATHAWKKVRDALSPPPRAAYSRWMLRTLLAAAHETPSFLERNAMRLGARASSDSIRGRAHALGVMARRGAERALGIGIELK